MAQLFRYIKSLAPYLLVIWVITILIFSSISKLPDLRIRTLDFDLRLDYLFHFLEYVALAFLAILTFASSAVSFSSRKVVIILAWLILFATLDESHQLFIPMRSFSLFDLFSDWSGIITGGWITLKMNRYWA